ncbi:hypothetical protein [Mesorhizobium sp.]|uniref:hypothetical protein n=1 Tax=Mesorhizobium sp. TaxID=1871066 RepID=UPI0025BE449E|nr:hypothetical protein [Mesorhizobium sp.]
MLGSTLLQDEQVKRFLPESLAYLAIRVQRRRDRRRFLLRICGYESIAIVELQANPVIATQRVMGVVEYVRVKPINPYGTIGHNLYYTYDLP